jgi:hypothetical protein
MHPSTTETREQQDVDAKTEGEAMLDAEGGVEEEPAGHVSSEDDDEELRRAIQASLQDQGQTECVLTAYSSLLHLKQRVHPLDIVWLIFVNPCTFVVGL